MNKSRYVLYLFVATIIATMGIAWALQPMPSLLTVSTPTATSTEQIQTEHVPTVTLAVEGRNYSAEISPSATVLEVMRSLEKRGLVFTGREFPSLGFFVESINGSASSGNLYWYLYINGKTSTRGAAQAALSDGDAVEWKLEEAH
jgi:hypothetical protein